MAHSTSDRDQGLSGLTARVAGWAAAGRAAWPGVALDEARFGAYVAARVRDDAAVATVHATDLYLTAACVDGDPAALAHFDRAYLAPLAPILGATGLARDQIDEVQQELRKKLLVADGGPPRLAEFSGRADLRTWVRTAAVRAGIDQVRRRRPVSSDDEELAALPAIADDPELLHLKDRYRDELRAALTDSLAALAPRDKLLLKYTYLDGLSVDKVGALYDVHKATAARWIAAAREALAEAAYRALIKRLGVTRSELHSIARLVESQLELSLRRLLA